MSSSSGQQDFESFIANALGYIIGAGSLLLYTPIAIRLCRQKSANGTTLSTWMLKLCSYTCSDVYSIVKKYPFSTYVDTMTVTVEAAVVLGLVVHYQKQWIDVRLWAFLASYVILSGYLLLAAPPRLVAAGQLASAFLNSAALFPQFVLNWQNKTKGDYSPITAGLATFGCAARIFTVQQLAGSDPVLVSSFGLAFVLNALLLFQILYYGVAVEGLSLVEVCSSDWASADDDSISREGDFLSMDDEDLASVEADTLIPSAAARSSVVCRIPTPVA